MQNCTLNSERMMCGMQTATIAFIFVIAPLTWAQSMVDDNEHKTISDGAHGIIDMRQQLGTGATALDAAWAVYNCPSGYFQCNKTAWQCVPQHLNCDGHADCDDASDETKCSNDADNKFWDHLFRKQPFGRHDDVPIGECAWPQSDVDCPCRAYDILCRFQELTSLPYIPPLNELETFDLTGNYFRVIDAHFFDTLPPVDILVLKSCSIATITPHAFQRFGEVELRILYLDENNIKELPEHAFSPNNTLKVLILSGNRLRHLHSHTFRELDGLEELDLRANQIETFTANAFENLPNLEKLYLNGNALRHIRNGMFPSLRSLHTLSLAQNSIGQIDAYSLPLPSLQHLFLAANDLSSIEARTFCPLSNLKGLHLNENKLQHIDLHAFDCLENLTSLLLTDNKFHTLEPRTLQNLTNLNYIYFSWFHLCRAALHVRVCEPKTDGISSFDNLLDNAIQRGAVWFMTVIAIVGNAMVIVGRCFSTTRRNAEHSLYLRHLALSDLIMGVYLAIIAIEDFRFRDDYIMHDAEWRSSYFCEVAGFLNTLSCVSSTFLLCLVTWDRLMSITRPLHLRDISKCKIVLRLIVLWCVSFGLAFAPVLPILYFGANFYTSNGVCLSLHIHDPYAQGWEYSALLFIVINSMSVLFISVSYMLMLKTILNSGQSLRSTVNGRHNQTLTARFAVIVITDCVCWLPVIIVKIIALMGFRISLDLYAWLAIFVLPLNSALNPILYTLTTKSFKQQLSGLCYAGNSSIELRTHTGNESGGATTSITQLGSIHSNSRRSPSRQRNMSLR